MTRKHLIAVAKILGEIENDMGRHRAATRFSELFKQDNPGFDGVRFHDAVDATAKAVAR